MNNQHTTGKTDKKTQPFIQFNYKYIYKHLKFKKQDRKMQSFLNAIHVIKPPRGTI